MDATVPYFSSIMIIHVRAINELIYACASAIKYCKCIYSLK